MRKLRMFFNKLAVEKGFHPTGNPDEWRYVFHYEVKQHEVCKLVIR